MEQPTSASNNRLDSLTYCIAFVKMLDHIRGIGADRLLYIQSVFPLGVVRQATVVVQTCVM